MSKLWGSGYQGRKKAAIGTIMAKIQTFNIILAAIVGWAGAFYGKTIFLLYAFSLFPIQMAVFFFLLIAQPLRFFRGFRRGEFKKKDYIIHSMPLIAISLFIATLYIAEIMKWNDPFSDDQFRIETTFKEDGTCDIFFNGEKRSDKSFHYEYRWGCGVGVGVYCQSDRLTGHQDFMMHFSKLLHQSPMPMHQNISLNKVDSRLEKFGVAYFDNALSRQYGTSINAVHWKLYSGSIDIEHVFTPYAGQQTNCSGLQKQAVIVGHFSGLAKRTFSGP